MPVTFDSFSAAVEKHFPLSCAYEWDNSGAILKTGDMVSHVLLALDLTVDVVKEAVRIGADTIFTHHPPIFKPLRSISFDDPVTAAVLEAAKNDINLYASHTSCDCAPGGLNAALADKLGLCDARIFAEDGCRFPGGGLGYAGSFSKELSSDEIITKVKDVFNVPFVRCSRVKGSFSKAAVIGGSAGEFYLEAARQGINVLITGEAKHNEFTEAAECGVLLIAAGHYETEIVFVDLAKRIICEELADYVKVSIATDGKSCFIV